MITLDWPTFNQKYMSKNRIFVLETDASWELFADDGIFKIHCTVDKYAEQTENMMFIERYFNNRPNIIKVLEIDDYEEEVEVFEPMKDEADLLYEELVEADEKEKEELNGNARQ